MSFLRVAAILKKGGIAVIPTDTLYGIVACALNPKAVGRLYSFRRERRKKPFIVLIPHSRALREFGVVLTSPQKKFLTQVWPGKVSVILPCPAKRFSYLHLGTHTLAFRVPKPQWLRTLLRKTGPLVAPSANQEGKKPAETIAEAKTTFGDAVKRYVSAGRRLRGKPSSIVSFVSNAPRVIRQGSVQIALSTLSTSDVDRRVMWSNNFSSARGVG